MIVRYGEYEARYDAVRGLRVHGPRGIASLPNAGDILEEYHGDLHSWLVDAVREGWVDTWDWKANFH